MIEVKNILKNYGKHRVIDDLSLSIEKGTVFGFLGPNGAGKTTTIKILVGINKPDSGSVMIDGQSPSAPRGRTKIGFMPEEPSFYSQLTGIEFMRFAGKLFAIKRTDEELEEILRMAGIYDARNKKIKTYSKGMKQRLGFAQALVNDPEYLFLDEPLEGLDPIGRREMKIMMNGLKEKGKTVFFNSHILSDVESMCDRIGIIAKGKLIYSGSTDEFRKNISLEEKFVEVIKNIE